MNKKNIGKRLAIFIIATMMLTVFSGCTEEETTTTTPAPTTLPPGFLTYENSTYGIKIMYPKEWEMMESYMGTVVIFLSPKESDSDVFQENLNVGVQDLSAQPMTLDEFTDLNIEQIKTLFTIEVVDSSPTTLANTPADKVIYNLKQGQYDLKLMQIYTIKDDIAYVITYTAEEDKYLDFLDTIQIMINTFEIL
ncbi:MAG: hypothetical protein KAV80_02095 [Methanomicrobia archaeon]|nr:hypothetical protein [Methanomicrobia archaeon]